TVGGTGEFVLGGSTNSSQLVANGAGTTVTLAPGIVVRGRGEFAFSGSANLINQGQVRSNVPGGILTLGAQSWQNTGLLVAEQGGTLTLQGSIPGAALGPFNSLGGVIKLQATVANAGNTIAMGPATGPLTFEGSVINGGTLQGTGGVGILGSS